MGDPVLDWPLRLGFGNREVSAADGTRLRIVEGGPKGGRRVVFLHGAPQLSYTWRRVMPALADRYRVIAPDLRGYGSSDLAVSGRYDLETLVDDLGRVLDATAAEPAAPEPVILVAHDWGGPIAWLFAAAHPERVRHLVAVNAPHPGAYATEVFHARQAARSWYIALFQVPKLERLIERADARLFLWMMRASSPPDAIDGDALALYRAALTRPGRAEAVLAYYRAQFRPGPGETLFERRRRAIAIPETSVPALVLWGEADKALAPSHPDALRPYARHLEIRRLPGVSHWVPEERPAEVVQSIRDADI